MDEKTKKVVVIAVVILAVVGAVVSGVFSMRGEQGKAGAYFGDPNGKPPKQAEMEAQEAARQRAQGTSAPVDVNREQSRESPGN